MYSPTPGTSTWKTYTPLPTGSVLGPTSHSRMEVEASVLRACGTSWPAVLKMRTVHRFGHVDEADLARELVQFVMTSARGIGSAPHGWVEVRLRERMVVLRQRAVLNTYTSLSFAGSAHVQRKASPSSMTQLPSAGSRRAPTEKRAGESLAAAVHRDHHRRLRSRCRPAEHKMNFRSPRASSGRPCRVDRVDKSTSRAATPAAGSCCRRP